MQHGRSAVYADTGATEKLLAHELRLKVREARDMNDELLEDLPELIVNVADISFRTVGSLVVFWRRVGYEADRSRRSVTGP